MVINPSCRCVDATGIIDVDVLRNWTRVSPPADLIVTPATRVAPVLTVQQCRWLQLLWELLLSQTRR